VQSAFSRYVAPALVQRLVDNPEALKIEGEKREMTFIFTDIAGFTTLSESIEPERLSQILNAYLDGMCRQVARFEGTVDKFIGDAVMCIFNAPLEQEDHAQRAVACALAMDTFSENFRSEMAKEGIKLGMTRIGVHTGSAVVGNFGSQSRMDFTALGDTVNAASRVEGVNKYFGTRLAVTEETRKRVTADTVHFRPIAHVVLKGKVLPLTLYEAISVDFAKSVHCVQYLEAFDSLDAGSDSAKAKFTELSKQYPDDSLVRFHQHRIEQGIVGTTVVMDEK
jgi:class 3 adenylate cyclase